MKYKKLIQINEDNCVNCHSCISVCKVKYCNDGSGEVIHLNDEMCIGCGTCIKRCTHNARILLDDFDIAMQSLINKDRVVAFVAPSIAANYPDKYLQFNGWLKSIGVEAIFDVSFGAELAIKSYVNHIKDNENQTLITTPCPAIVSYIELYKPELIPYLAPFDSPMGHTMKMVNKHYPEYRDAQFIAISPCLAKKREFEDTGIGALNVTMAKIDDYLSQNNINLEDYNAVDYDNHSAERAVLFSSPGGLLKTIERDLPGISKKTRKIEGIERVYNYFDLLEEEIKKGTSPILIDCLSCELGCNGGPGTHNNNKSPDDLEYLLEQRKKEKDIFYKNKKGNDMIDSVINKYWIDSDFSREFFNLSFLNKTKKPTKEELETISKSMYKYEKSDFKDCTSCGYDDCEKMSFAIYNNLNKSENCHFYLHKELTYIAYHDSNTDLLNRSAFEEKLIDVLKNARRSKPYKTVGVIYLDVDHFKDINEALGHLIGDILLQKVSERLNTQIIENDSLFRIGGDEFAIISYSNVDEATLSKLANKILHSFNEPFFIEDHNIHLQVSIGITNFPKDGEDSKTIIRNANTALNEAKKERNCFKFYTSIMHRRAIEKIEILNKLREAIELNQFEVHYQPQVDITGKIVGVEALIRWKHNIDGIIPPDKFIHHAEDTGLILEIGAWVLEKACLDFQILKSMGLDNINLSVNLSIRQFRDNKLLSKIETILKKTQMDPKKLHLEITESTLLTYIDATILKINKLTKMGIQFALDDFGTGYSSLGYLSQLSLSILKIDKTFVDLITEPTRKVHLIDTILMMGRGLDLKIIAEGIESQNQVDYFSQYKNVIRQGYFYSKPLPLTELIGFIKHSNKMQSIVSEC